MSREVKQIIETEDTVTVIVENEYGTQYSGTRSHSGYSDSKAEAIEKATQDALNK